MVRNDEKFDTLVTVVFKIFRKFFAPTGSMTDDEKLRLGIWLRKELTAHRKELFDDDEIPRA